MQEDDLKTKELMYMFKQELLDISKTWKDLQDEQKNFYALFYGYCMDNVRLYYYQPGFTEKNI